MAVIIYSGVGEDAMDTGQVISSGYLDLCDTMKRGSQGRPLPPPGTPPAGTQPALIVTCPLRMFVRMQIDIGNECS